MIDGWIDEAREREREREGGGGRGRDPRCSSRALRCTLREKTRAEKSGRLLRGGTNGRRRRRKRKRKRRRRRRRRRYEEETVGLRASPARVGAYIDHERVHDIREYIIRGL